MAVSEPEFAPIRKLQQRVLFPSDRIYTSKASFAKVSKYVCSVHVDRIIYLYVQLSNQVSESISKRTKYKDVDTKDLVKSNV